MCSFCACICQSTAARPRAGHPRQVLLPGGRIFLGEEYSPQVELEVLGTVLDVFQVHVKVMQRHRAARFVVQHSFERQSARYGRRGQTRAVRSLSRHQALIVELPSIIVNISPSRSPVPYPLLQPACDLAHDAIDGESLSIYCRESRTGKQPSARSQWDSWAGESFSPGAFSTGSSTATAYRTQLAQSGSRLLD